MPEIRQRKINPIIYDKAILSGCNARQARIIASRVTDENVQINSFIRPDLSNLYSSSLLKDVNKGATRIAQAVMNNEVIVLATDWDSDGTSSSVLGMDVMINTFHVPENKISVLIGNRKRDAFGLSDAAVERILKMRERPSLVITADMGSGDAHRISLLAKEEIDVIVTDHHEISSLEELKRSAYALINPQQPGCEYPDKAISGAVVFFLVLSRVREILIENKSLPEETPTLSNVMDYLVLSTIADCMSLTSLMNRAIVLHGLNLMNQQNSRPCWNAFKKEYNKSILEVSDIGFYLSSLVNSSSRLTHAMNSYRFLSAKTDCEAEQYLKALILSNNERKRIENKMKDIAILDAQRQVDAGCSAIVCYDDANTSGVQGIVASRLIEKFGKPSVVLSKKVSGDITGSARSIEGINIKSIFDSNNAKHSGLLKASGGHKFAGGMTVSDNSSVELFHQAFDHEVKIIATKNNLILKPFILSDGKLDSERIALNTLDEINELQPYGCQFEIPIYEGSFTIKRLKVLGVKKQHLKLWLLPENMNYTVEAVWFYSCKKNCPVFENDKVFALYTLGKNTFRGESKIQLVLKMMEKI